MLLSAWRSLLPPNSTFAGATAAWLLGLDLDPTNPVEIVAPYRSGVRPRAGLSVRRCDIAESETVTIRGLRATTLHRTLVDLCIQRTAVEALAAIDMAVRAGLTDTAALSSYCETVKGPGWITASADACNAGGAGRVADGDAASMAAHRIWPSAARGAKRSPR